MNQPQINERVPFVCVFDKGGVDKSSHPLYVDPRHQQLSARTNELFGRLGEPVIELRGLMRVESGRFVFESLGDVSP